ncbi:atp12p [Saccharomyces arboricola H-6]|uniref:Atp12p n=1 Tax=Saccharomyces arboricola (strain H-6 / AS 2.3317 / CBS 10644) TaxID=1160507 RepID=J8Q3K0_SACAR|nr:atp12p [Saccharomyces arboricola H-6]
MLASLKAGRCIIRSIRSTFPRFYSLSAQPLGVDSTIENNSPTETNRLSKTSQKFWEKVSLNRDSENKKIALQLDGKTIRTPLGNGIIVDDSRSLLAYLLKLEWSSLSSLSIKTHSLPLTSLVARCIDLQMINEPGCDPQLIAKIGGNSDAIKDQLLRYLDTDTLLVFSPINEFEGKLRTEQNESYLPLIKGIEGFLSKFSSKPDVQLQVLDADIHGLRGNQQSDIVKDAATKYMDGLSPWDLAILEKAVLTTKSFICGVLLLENKKYPEHLPSTLRVDMETIVRAATLETIFQTEKWGELEDTHDVDKRDFIRKIHTAAIAAFEQ